MTVRQEDNVQCEMISNPDREWLANAWKELEKKAESNVFLSWFWIGTWLSCFVDDFTVIEARKQGEIVGLGILVAKKRQHLLQHPHTKYSLHRTGETLQDQIFIEYNDYLLDKRYEEQVRAAMTSIVIKGMKRNDAYVIGVSLTDKYEILQGLGVIPHIQWDSKAFLVDFETLKQNNTTLDQSISRSSRYQIKRSLKKYADYGDICIKKASSIEEAKTMLNLAKPLHIQRWGHKKGQSAFANPEFIRFHHCLIEKGIPSGKIALYHLCAGSETIGVIYNFQYDAKVSFYLSALNYEHNGAHYKPGLVAHYLLIKKAIDEGNVSYDFLAGLARYKQTFANKEQTLALYQCEQPRLLPTFEETIRKIKQNFTG